MSTFQSYLVIGDKDSRRAQTHRIAKSLSVDLSQPSPDVFIISPQKTLRLRSGQAHVTINQIRQLKQHIFQKPVKNPFKFVIIEEAHKTTQEAQNTLLKILEEPPKQAIIVLEASNKSQLLPTILSRVVIKQAYGKKLSQIQNPAIFYEKDVKNLLTQIPEIDDPQTWLDNQIYALFFLLKRKTQGEKVNFTYTQLTNTIEKCSQTKQIIEANVNPKFALASLFFSTYLASK